MSDSSNYQSPLGSRYASPAMQRLWSPGHRAHIWRKIWLTLAQHQQRLGLNIPDEAIAEMQAHLLDADLEQVLHYEHRFRHDVMAHIHAFADQAPAARPFIHLGATSAFVTDNADLIIMRDALRLLLGRLVAVLKALSAFAIETRNIPTVAYTHFQPAQLTTVGKRAALWLQDFFLDTSAVHDLADTLPLRGCKGTTGTQASYLDLFHGDHDKVQELDTAVAQTLGFGRCIDISGQTYTRKLDSNVLGILSGIAQSASKFANDLRLLQHEDEVLEPAEREQVGSSAMPYKRNPMRAERISGLSRHVMTLTANTAATAATQWLERTLDDSANRRMTLPEGFLSADAVLVLCTNVAAGLEVRRDVVARNVNRVMPFMASERWLMRGVEAGGDRQALHEVIRKHSSEVSTAMASGAENDLLERLSADPAFESVDATSLRADLDPEHYIGRAPEQVLEFVEGPLADLLTSMSSYEAPDEAAVTL